MTAPRHIQTKQAPTEVTDEAIRVGWKPDHAANEDVLGRKAGHVVRPEDQKPIVTDWTGMEDWANCPPSYAVWAEQYQNYTHTMVRRFGVYRNVEEIVQEIMWAFYRKDSLGVFTPDWGSKSKSGKSNFRSYYTRHIFTYVISQRRNWARGAHKHCMIFDAPVGTPESGDTSTWGDVKAPVVEPETNKVEFDELVGSLRTEFGDEFMNIVLDLAMNQDRQIRQTDLSRALGMKGREASSALAKVRAAITAHLRED
jgi:DNA-directed RNA polymerase specialized sigma24 family protein